MFRLFIILCGFFIHNANATPYIYQFDGKIDFVSSYTDSTGEIILYNTGESIALGNNLFTVGEALQYKIYLDFARPGRCYDPYAILSDQCKNINIIDPLGIDFFYADLISATKLVSDNYLNIDYNFGRSGFVPVPGILQVDSSVYVEDGLSVQEWIEGMHFIGVDAWDNGNDIYGYISSSLELTSIVPAPVPEPRAFFLLLVGLATLTLSILLQPRIRSWTRQTTCITYRY